MTEDEKAFAALVHVFEEAKRNYDMLAKDSQREPEYQKERGKYHTPTSMADYKRALKAHDESKQLKATAEASVNEAIKQLDNWIPKPVHERLAVGVFITAPTPGGFVGLGKDDGQYQIVHAPSEIALEQAIAEFKTRALY